jgi:hypothetical protein
MRNPYQTRTGEAWLRPSWVVYLDILGFVASIRRAAESRKQEEHLKQLRSALTEAREDLREGIENPSWSRDRSLPAPYAIKVFTDNIVLGFPIHSDGESEFGSMIARVGQYQYTLLKHGFFVRGGVAYGDLYMDDDVVYGKGLLDAYDAESTLARDPRIVLGPSAMAQVHTHLAWYDEVATAPHNEHLLVDSDSQMFVNYLAIPIDGLEPSDPLPSEYHDDLAKHRDLIVSRLQEFTKAPPLWSKYSWVGAYHNLFCTEFISGARHLIAPEMLSHPALRLATVYTRKGRHIYRDGEVVGTFKSMFEYKTQTEPK